MLQIVQGKYFREGVPLTETLHRSVFYTNLQCFREQDLEFCFGTLRPSTNFLGERSLTIEAMERQETLGPDGSPDAFLSTTGEQLLDEIADVIAFALNVVCLRDFDMARRLISQTDVEEIKRGSASILRQTFDRAVTLTAQAITDLDEFSRALTSLHRKSYEAAMRAIGQIVDATLMVGEDATLAYTLMVAALESLGQAAEVPPAVWSDFDQNKRKRIDDATAGLEEDAIRQIRAAVLANEHHSLQRRFIAFVLDHVEPSFYRDEAVNALRPIRADDLPKALKQAYAIRSRNVHLLHNIPPEVWISPDRSETACVDRDILLSLEGLARLCRHVVRRFIERAPRSIDTSFKYRESLPGMMRVRIAAQHWIFQGDGFDKKSAPDYLDGMLDVLIEGLSGRADYVLIDITAVLEKIEKIALGLSRKEDRLPLAGIMTIWNKYAPPDKRRNISDRLSARFQRDLGSPSMVAFALTVVSGGIPDWNLNAICGLADHRRLERRSTVRIPFPPRIDAALDIVAAARLLEAGDREKALQYLSFAVEAIPGVETLIAYEKQIVSGEDPQFNLGRFIWGLENYVILRGQQSEGRPVADC